MNLVEATLEAILIKRPEATATWPQHLCLDKGYDYDVVRQTLEEWGYTAHIRRRGEEVQAKHEIAGYRARRWVVESSQL
jgi:putative transposase